MMICLELGETLKFFRNRAKLSKTEVANYLNLTTATITNYESGSTIPSLLSMAKLKTLYGPEFEYSLTMIVDEGKTAYIAFKDYEYDIPSNGLTFEEMRYPNFTRVKAYITEYDAQHGRQNAVKHAAAVIAASKSE